MVASVSRPVVRYRGGSCRWWLSARRLGNGLDNDTRVPILEISERITPEVLSSARRAGLPAYALAHPADRSRSGDGSAVSPCYQLLAGASAHGEADGAVLLAQAPSLAREAADKGDTAWR
jgi:hypothetical protein